jgi:hypothetical protein
MANQLTTADVQALIAAALAPVQQDLVDAQAEMQRLQGQIIQQAAAFKQPGAPAQPQFARTPATATTTMINYNFKMDSEKLKSEFDLSSTNQPQFMEEIDCRSGKQGWKGTILDINGTYFIRSYVTFTYDMVLAHVCQYAFQSDQEEQDVTSLQICLEDTLTSSALATINAERSKYTLT